MQCKKCGCNKAARAFARDSSRPSGRHPYCLTCARVYGRAYAATHRTEARARVARWLLDNKARAQAYRADPATKARIRVYMRKYRRTHLARKRALAKTYERTRQAADVNYRLAVSLRKRLGVAIRDNAKAGSAVRDLGCTIAALKQYLEARFLPGMSWDNWGRKGWHIDHVIPLSAFDLTDRKQFLKAVHYTNLQPLWADDNCRKGNRLLVADA